MKEIGYTLDIATGLRLREKMPRDHESLEVCFGLVPRFEGLVTPTVISESIASISANHPWPQIFFGDSFWLLCDKYKIYIINADWSVTLAIDTTPYYGTFPAAPRGVWDFEDFHDFVLLTNGGVTVLYSVTNSQWEYNDGTTIPTLGSITNFNGQLVGTGVEEIVGDSKTVFQGTDERFVMWGGIGSANFVIDQSNIKGNKALVGEQYKVKRLGDYVVAYGAREINILKPSGVNYGLHRTFKYGIASRGAVGGNEKNHVFIDVYGNFYHIDEDLKITGPSYKEFFSAMLGNEVVVNHIEGEETNDFFITDGVVSYQRTNEGCGQIERGYTGIGVLGASVVGVATDLNDDSAFFTTNPQSFGTPANKTVTMVELDCEFADTVYLAVESRRSRNDAWESSDWVEVNDAGAAAITMNGSEFKIKAKCDTRIGFDPDSLIVRVKFDDRRFVRGLSNANKTDRRTGV